MSVTAAGPDRLTASSLSGGVLVSTLTPFNDYGEVFCDPITDQAKRIAAIKGVLGIAVNTTLRERQTLSPSERLNVIRCTLKGLKTDQLLLACVGDLSEKVLDEVEQCQKAGADAVIAFPSSRKTDTDLDAGLSELATLADRSALPVILALGHGPTRWAEKREEIATLTQRSRRIIGIDMGAHDNVLTYDQDYYALKSINRPLACLPSSEGALFHNLNTGGDGVLSCLAYIAPHEVSTLYQATRTGDFPLAQAVHNRLAPLVSLLDGHDRMTREMIYREAAHLRGLLATPTARDLPVQLDQAIRSRLEATLDDIALEPISWV